MSPVAVEVEVAGRSLRLTNLGKVLWPRTGTTKGELLRYYGRIAPVLLPHVERRPLTLARFPDGVEGKGWFQTTCPSPPPWLPTYPLEQPDGRVSRDYCVVDEPAALLWVANLGAVELHPLLGRLPRVDRPTVVAFDLDPGERASLADCCDVALVLRDALAGFGLRAFAKVSGWAGLHVVVPLNRPHDYRHTKGFARTVAGVLARRDPDAVTDRSTRAGREGKVLVDWAQNNEHRSLAAPYSLRALPWPSVSAPVTWGEVEDVAATRDATPLAVHIEGVFDRLDRLGDLFAPVLDIEQQLPAVP